MQKIIHIDMDAFYASVEQRDYPELRGKAIAVGHPGARSVLTTASYEARKFGVRSAMPSTIAMRKCPELLIVPPRFDAYREASQQIHTVFAEFTALIEPLSLDEAYLDVTENLLNLPLASDVAAKIRERIYEMTGLTASAGISYNKFLAKMASSQRKPNGQFVIPPERGEAFVAALPIEKFYGVGPATAEKMKKLGIQNGSDLKNQSLPFLQHHFGKSGHYFYQIARGVDDRQVQPDRVRKSVGAENTFSSDLFDLEKARLALLPIVDKVSSYATGKGLSGKTITLKIKYADFTQITRSRSLGTMVSQPLEITPHVIDLLQQQFPTEKGIRLLGVTLSSLNVEEESDKSQMTLAI